MVPQKNSKSSFYHILKGFHDRSILAKNNRGKTILTNFGTPCSQEDPVSTLETLAANHTASSLPLFLTSAWRPCNGCDRQRWKRPTGKAECRFCPPRHCRRCRTATESSTRRMRTPPASSMTSPGCELWRGGTSSRPYPSPLPHPAKSKFQSFQDSMEDSKHSISTFVHAPYFRVLLNVQNSEAKSMAY